MKKICASLAATVIALTLAGCSNPILVAANQKALQPLADDPIPGFELSLKYDPSCGIDYCTVNPRYEFTSKTKVKSQAEFCVEFLAWATKHGADSWLFDPEYISIPLKGHEASFQIACASGKGELLGTADGGVRWMLSGNPTAYGFSTVLNTDGQLDDARTKLVGWNDAIGQLSSGAQRNLEILDAVNSYRLSHPAEKQSSPSTIKRALEKVAQSADLQLISDGKGQVKALKVPADEFLLERCISVEPYDEAFFLTPNPGTGIFGSYRSEEDEPIQEFGFITSCN